MNFTIEQNWSKKDWSSIFTPIFFPTLYVGQFPPFILDGYVPFDVFKAYIKNMCSEV